jgi:predicted transcriptional regulator
MEMDNTKLSVDEIIASLQNLNNAERKKLQNALFELQNDIDLKNAIQENLDDIKNGRVSAHESIMKEIKATYNA